MSDVTTQATEAAVVLSLAELARITAGTVTEAPAATATSYAVDSRAVGPGTVFFALVGERTDGHRYLDDVRAHGAIGAVVKRGTATPAGLPCVQVDDPAAALADLGRHFRWHWPLRVVGITGSAGKTTTKEFTADLLASRFRVFRSVGNLNTTIGLPLTLTARRPDEEIAVLELGMSYPGELRRVAAIAEPDVAVITNVGLAHVGNFKSADEVARAKAEILEKVRPDGAFVANADDARVMAMATSFTGRVVTFGIRNPADVRARDIVARGTEGTTFEVVTADGAARARLAMVGAHHVLNVLAALATAAALGLDPLELAPYVGRLGATNHRGGLVRLGGDVTLLDDCYNANPDATLSAIDALGTLPGGRRVAILGDMRELGEFSETSHQMVGRHAAAASDVVIGVGPESLALVEEARAAGSHESHHMPDATTAAEAVVDLVRDGDAILVKGSRGIGLEVVVDALVKARGEA